MLGAGRGWPPPCLTHPRSRTRRAFFFRCCTAGSAGRGGRNFAGADRGGANALAEPLVPSAPLRPAGAGELAAGWTFEPERLPPTRRRWSTCWPRPPRRLRRWPRLGPYRGRGVSLTYDQARPIDVAAWALADHESPGMPQRTCHPLHQRSDPHPRRRTVSGTPPPDPCARAGDPSHDTNVSGALVARVLAIPEAVTTVPLAGAKDHLSEYIAGVEHTHDRVVITRHGRPTAILVSR